ncbi:MAG: WD40 repeat domain-containing protein [Planctomycetes bacterium]|nr:WD40 repeat domain-containing protein [Planctomycetota bacterium]
MRLLTVTGTALVDCLAFSLDGARVAAACRRANVRVWDAGSGKPAFTLRDTKNALFVGFTADPDRLVTSSWGASPILWDLRAGTSRPLGSGHISARDTALSRDGTRIALAEGAIVCRDVATGGELWRRKCDDPSNSHTHVRFDAAGERLFVVTHCVAVRDAATGKERNRFDLVPGKHVTVGAAAVSPDGRWVATRAFAGLRVYDSADGRVVFEEPSVESGQALAFTPDGSGLAAGRSGRGGIDFWHVGTWRRGAVPNPGIGEVLSLAFSPDGLLGAAGGLRGKVALWDRE